MQEQRVFSAAGEKRQIEYKKDAEKENESNMLLSRNVLFIMMMMIQTDDNTD